MKHLFQNIYHVVNTLLLKFCRRIPFSELVLASLSFIKNVKKTEYKSVKIFYSCYQKYKIKDLVFLVNYSMKTILENLLLFF